MQNSIDETSCAAVATFGLGLVDEKFEKFDELFFILQELRAMIRSTGRIEYSNKYAPRDRHTQDILAI